MRYTAYIILSAECEGEDAIDVVVREYKNGTFSLAGGSVCQNAEMEIDESLFNSLLQQYIYNNGSAPGSYEGGTF